MTFLLRRSRTTRAATATAVQQQQSTPESAPATATRQAPCSYWVRRRLQSESRSS